jgi:glycosyltransferase domain-containing protein
MSIYDVKSNNLLGKITIIIFARERHQKLKKVLEYWGNSPVKVIVLHRTIAPLKISEVPNNANYVNCDFNYAKRADLALNLIKTEFSIICSDDEVYLLSALNVMVNIIAKDIKLKSIGGQCIAVSNYGNKVAATKAYIELVNYSIESDDPTKRLEMHLLQNLRKTAVGGMYRLMRSDDMVCLLRIFSKTTGINSPYIFEATGEIYTALIGNCTYLKNVYWIRNWESEIISTPDWDRNNDFSDWWFNSDNSNMREMWVETILQEVKIDINVLKLNFILNQYFSNQKLIKRKKYKRKKYKNINLHNIKYFLRSIFPFIKQITVLESLFIDLNNEGQIFDEKEVTGACEYIL